MKKIKLLLISPYFPLSAGGVQKYVYHIGKGLLKNYNYEVVVITSNHESPKEYKEEDLDGMKVYRLPRQFKLSNTPISFKWKKQIKEIIKKEKPDIINAHAPVPFISNVACKVAYENKIPFILTYHGGSTIFTGSIFVYFSMKIYENILLKSVLKRSNNIICSSEFVRLGFLKKYTNKSVTITPSVDTNLFKPDNTSRLARNKLLFVAANLIKSEKYKGLDYLLKSIPIVKEKIKDIHLVVIGDGKYLKHYKRLCNELNTEKNVSFKGKLYDKDLVKEYQNSDIFILPSIFDSCPLVLLEAMACKKPLIGTNICGIPYLIKDGENGLLFPPRDYQALSDAIIKLLTNPKLAKKMGENGYKKVKENFTWDIAAHKTNKIIKSILRK